MGKSYLFTRLTGVWTCNVFVIGVFHYLPDPTCPEAMGEE